MANVPFAKWTDEGWKINPRRGVITSQGCACEDYQRALDLGRTSQANKIILQVAPLTDTAGRPQDKLEKMRRGEVLRIFYIYGEAGTVQDQLVDLDGEQGIPAFVLAGLPKVARLGDWQWRGLLIHGTVNRWGRSAEEIFGEERAKELRDG